MAAIPGGVRFTGFVAPSDTTDTYPVIDNTYGIGGYREVANLADRDAITTQRRRIGMMVFVQDQNKIYTLQNGIDNINWTDFSGGGILGVTTVDKGGTGLTAIASGNLLFGNNSTTAATSNSLHWDNVNNQLQLPGLVLTSKSLSAITAGQLEYNGTSLYFSSSNLVRTRVIVEPATPAQYTILNHITTSRIIDANDLTLDQVANLVCTILKDLKDLNLLSTI